MVKYIEDKFDLDLSSKECKKKLSQTEEQRWDSLSNEKKFEEAAGNLPFAMFFYMIEAAFVVCGMILVLQLFDVVQIIPPEYMKTITSLTRRVGTKIDKSLVSLPKMDSA